MEFTSGRPASLNGVRPIRHEAVGHNARSSDRQVNYSEQEVEALLEWFTALHHQTDAKQILVRYADLTAAVAAMDPGYREVMLTYGVLGLTQRDTGKALGISQSTVGRKYRRAVEQLLRLINGNPRRLR